MSNGLDTFVDAALVVADTAVKTTVELKEKGKLRIEAGILRRKIAKNQRQLGALVYTLEKNGAANQTMVDHYVRELDGLLQELAVLEQAASAPAGEDKKDAVFCCRDRK